jgi:hypothetical protein
MFLLYNKGKINNIKTITALNLLGIARKIESYETKSQILIFNRI